ncbi:MAG: hypothetical protein Q9177_000550 [Variospora cf. flavescens]
MRCISYGAALPQRGEEPLKPQLYGEMVWKLDMDYLQCADKLPKPVYLGSHHTHETLFRLEDSHYTIAETTDENVESVGALAESFKNAKVQKLDLSIDLESQGISAVKMTSSLLTPGRRLRWEPSTKPDLAALEAADTAGVDFSMPHERSTVFACVSTDTADAAREDVPHEVQLVHCTKPVPMLPAIQKTFETMGWLTTTSKLADCRKNVVMLVDLEGFILSMLHDDALAAMQAISTSASSLLWVTKGGLLTDKKPGFAMAAGLALVITSEQLFSLFLLELVGEASQEHYRFEADPLYWRRLEKVTINTCERVGVLDNDIHDELGCSPNNLRWVADDAICDPSCRNRWRLNLQLWGKVPKRSRLVPPVATPAPHLMRG